MLANPAMVGRVVLAARAAEARCPLFTWPRPLETAEKPGGARVSSALEDLMRRKIVDET